MSTPKQDFTSCQGAVRGAFNLTTINASGDDLWGRLHHIDLSPTRIVVCDTTKDPSTWAC